MKNKFIAVLTLALCALLISCSETPETSDDDTVKFEYVPPLTTTEESVTVTTVENSAVTTAVSTTTTAAETTDPGFSETETVAHIEMPQDFSQTNQESVESFDFSKFGEFVKNDSLNPLALDGEYAYFEKHIFAKSESYETYIYKFNINTGEVTQLEGCIPDTDYLYYKYAFADGKIIGTSGSDAEDISWIIDTQQNSVYVTNRQSADLSRGYTFMRALNGEEYASIWFDNQAPYQTYHVKVCDTSGNGREVITNKYNMGSERYVYTANDNKIYECAQTNKMTQVYLNVYDTDGNSLSSIFLEEITQFLGRSDIADLNAYVASVDAFGDYVGISVDTGMPSLNEYYIYRLNDDFTTSEPIVIGNGGLYYVSTYKSVDKTAENHIFYTVDDSNGDCVYNIYSLNNSGEFTALAETTDSKIIFDGKTVVFLKDNALEKIIF